MNLVYNEKTVLDKFLNENECSVKKHKLIPILVKYYYTNGIEDKLKLREKILEDLYNLDNDNIRSVWINKVDKCIKEFMKNIKDDRFVIDIIDVDSVDIYEEELKLIESASQVRYKKLLFVLLVWAKIYKKFNREIVLENIRDLLNLAKCKTGDRPYRNSILREITLQGFLVSEYKSRTCYIKINYLKEEGEVAFTVDDIENAIYYYLNWSGEKWIKCSECGKYFKKTNNKANSLKYCNKCSKKKDLEKKLRYYHKNNS